MAQPRPPPGLQEATKKSTIGWQEDLESLFHHTKDRFPDVVWELIADDDEPGRPPDEIYSHKAIVYARAPASFQNRYFSRPNGASSPLPYSSPYLAESVLSLSLGLADQPTSATPRTPSPYRAPSPSTIAAQSMAPPTFLRLTTSMNPTIFSNELEYLYTGKGFGEAFEFLFDESREHAVAQGTSPDDAEALRVDKLRKDLVFMWRSRLYSDVRISLTGNFGGSQETTTAIFSSHRFILVSRSSYFQTQLLAWPNKSAPPRSELDPPTIKLPSPPFTPASLHFTLGFIYTGTLVFSHRSYDLSTAFAILRAALYLELSTLHDEIQARIAQEMLHGLFHAFITFNEYERLTAGSWGTGGCRCRQCARRVPRVLEFALSEDVKNPLLERGARRALVGLFGEGWCTSEFASLPQKIRDNALLGLGKRTTVQNFFSLLFAAEHALSKLGNQIEPWADIVRDMILTARKAIDDIIAKDAETCFNAHEWIEIMENDGVRFEDGEKVEWAMASMLRGVKESFAPSLYQTLVSSILLRPHPTEVNAPHLSATSHIRVQVEQTRLELLKWIGHRWLAIRQARGFDLLEGWALKEISDHIEVPVEDLLNPPTSSRTGLTIGNSSKRAPSGLLLRPISNHPHTSKVDADSEAASSMRVSVLSRSLALREHPSAASMASRDAGLASSRSSVQSVARSTASRVSTSTVSATPQASKRARKEGSSTISPARRLANEVRAKDKAKERPDSKLTPSIVKPDDYLEEEDDYEGENESLFDNEERSVGNEQDDRESLAPSENLEEPDDTAMPETPVKKVLITRASLASVKSATGKSRLKSSPSAKSQSTLRSSVASGPSNGPSRPNSRASTRSSRLNVSVTGSGPRTRAISRPISSLSTSVSPSTRTGTVSSRPTSSISTSSAATTDTLSTFRTASIGSTPTLSRSRRPSAASSVVTTGQRSSTTSSPVLERARKISGASVASVASTASSIRNSQPAEKKSSAGPSPDPEKLSPASAAIPRPIQPSSSRASTDSLVKKAVPAGTHGRKPVQEKQLSESIAPRSPPVPQVPVPVLTQLTEKEVTRSEKENSDPTEQSTDQKPSDSPTIPRTLTGADVVNEHKKTSSSASSSSVATLKRKSSTDTIRTLRSIPLHPSAMENNRISKALPPPPLEATQSLPVALTMPIDAAEAVPRGATLEVGIPCIISSKRKRFKAYARYIGEVEGETGPWVGVEVPMPIGDNWGDSDNVNKFSDERQWHDGSWGGIQYFEIGGVGSEMDYTDDRAPRRRRLEGSGGSFGDSLYGRAEGKGILKREGDQLSITSDRMKRMRSASPAVSDISGTESRGLFVRPSQVIYVVDAVGADL